MTEDEAEEYFTKEWNRIGVFYKYDHSRLETLLYGNRKGIEQFADLLDNSNSFPTDSIGRRINFLGPYAYLKLLVTDRPIITSETIGGSSQDLTRLAMLIRQKTREIKTNDSFIIGSEYSKEAQVKIRFTLMEDDFKPHQME